MCIVSRVGYSHNRLFTSLHTPFASHTLSLPQCLSHTNTYQQKATPKNIPKTRSEAALESSSSSPSSSSPPAALAFPLPLPPPSTSVACDEGEEEEEEEEEEEAPLVLPLLLRWNAAMKEAFTRENGHWNLFHIIHHYTYHRTSSRYSKLTERRGW